MTVETKMNTAQIPDEKFRILGINEDESEKLARKRVGYWADAWRRFKQNKIALAAGILLLILIFFIIFGPAISGYNYEAMDQSAINQLPSAEHWFGTDTLGRDLFARVWQGGRISIIIGLVAAAVSSIIGSIYGGIAAYFGGTVDDIMMRIVEVLLSMYRQRTDAAAEITGIRPGGKCPGRISHEDHYEAYDPEYFKSDHRCHYL